ncbi:MAG: hypothetical protein AABZ55_02275 [Bdellovibrionota bacterium]
MIIHKPEVRIVGEILEVSARVELRSPKRGRSIHLWFRFPENTHSLLSLDSDPFVVALLLLAMQNGEDIDVKGTLSPRLLAGLHEYQQKYHSWFPKRFHLVEIKPSGLRETSVENITRISSVDACAFSGGVDSFYTLLKLLGRGNSDRGSNLKYTLFMSGFDMPLHLTDSISELTRSYSTLMTELGINFIHGSTNIREFVNSVDWTNSHGQALSAAALFFRNSIDRFFIPSSYTRETYPKWGTHPELDPLLSNETMKFVHHGAEANRVKKLETVSLAPESYNRLRVCWIQDIGLKNCGRCEKCVRTMIALDLLGKLGAYSTFITPLSRRKVRSLILRTHQSRLFARELIAAAARKKVYHHAFDLSISLLRREFFYRGTRKLRNISHSA